MAEECGLEENEVKAWFGHARRLQHSGKEPKNTPSDLIIQHQEKLQDKLTSDELEKALPAKQKDPAPQEQQVAQETPEDGVSADCLKITASQLKVLKHYHKGKLYTSDKHLAAIKDKTGLEEDAIRSWFVNAIEKEMEENSGNKLKETENEVNVPKRKRGRPKKGQKDQKARNKSTAGEKEKSVKLTFNLKDNPDPTKAIREKTVQQFDQKSESGKPAGIPLLSIPTPAQKLSALQAVDTRRNWSNPVHSSFLNPGLNNQNQEQLLNYMNQMRVPQVDGPVPSPSPPAFQDNCIQNPWPQSVTPGMLPNGSHNPNQNPYFWPQNTTNPTDFKPLAAQHMGHGGFNSQWQNFHPRPHLPSFNLPNPQETHPSQSYSHLQNWQQHSNSISMQWSEGQAVQHSSQFNRQNVQFFQHSLPKL